MQRDELQVLEVQEAVPSNAGVIEVVARNPYGEVSCSANLAVQGKQSGNIFEIFTNYQTFTYACYCFKLK